METVTSVSCAYCGFVRLSPRGDCVVLLGEFFREEQWLYAFGFLNTSQPENLQWYETEYPIDARFLVSTKIPTLAVLRRSAMDPKSEFHLSLIDANSKVERKADLKEWVDADRQEFLDIRDGRLSFAGTMIPGVPLPCAPPAPMLLGVSFGALLAKTESDMFIGLAFQQNRYERYIGFNKDKSEWTQYRFGPVKGDKYVSKVLAPWICYQIGWDYPEADIYGPARTGEWILRNFHNGEETSVYLDPDSDIYWTDGIHFIGRAGERLVSFRVDPAKGPAVVDAKPPFTAENLPYTRCMFFGPETKSVAVSAKEEGEESEVLPKQAVLERGFK